MRITLVSVSWLLALDLIISSKGGQLLYPKSSDSFSG